MIGIYKRGGPHKKNGTPYSFMAVSKLDLQSYLSDGWVIDINDIEIEEAEFKSVETIPESGSDYEAEFKSVETIPESGSDYEAEFKSVETIPESGSDYEAELRAKIKSLGGKPGGRSSIETLEKQLKELENGTDS